jgi:hypothetical protein
VFLQTRDRVKKKDESFFTMAKLHNESAKKMLQFPPFIDSSNSENAIKICHVKKIDFKIHYVGHD